MDRVDTRRSTPLHRQLATVMRGRIASGQYAVGTTIPTEQALAQSFNVSRATVRQAIKSLTTEGLLKAKAGVGTLVIRAQAPVKAATLRGLTEDLRQQGIATYARTLSAQFETATPAIRKALELVRDERVLHLTRVRDIAGSPLALLNSYIPESVGLMPDENFSGPLYELVERSHRLHIIYGKDSIGARVPTTLERDLLQITDDTPVLTIRRTAYLEFDRPIEYVEAAIRSDLYEYNITLSR